MNNRIKKATRAQIRRRVQVEMLGLLVQIDFKTTELNKARRHALKVAGVTDKRRDVAALRRTLSEKVRTLRELSR